MSEYTKITARHYLHLMNLLQFIHDEVLSAGGDGDALWYSCFYEVNDIKLLIEEFNSKQKFPWEIKFDGSTIQWGTNQEWATITNDEGLYLNAPSWIQLKIKN